jgi:inositol-phosphate transport system ATP-binding protein
MKVTLENLTKRFGEVIGAEYLNLKIGDGEFVALLGPSGCGKTTTLLMIAGIYKPTEGTIKFDGKVVNDLAPKDRNIGMVFQSYALYPHMTVFENLTFPLMLKKTSKEEMKRRAQRVADMMGIGHLMDRKPAQLSGGQQQRVALGRALVKEPDLLLFDEPLSNLDARLRLTMRGEIKRLQMDLGITSIYVTHDQVEAMTMADRIAVMHKGHLQAAATPDDLYDRPQTLFIAGFIGNPPMNFIDVEVIRENGDYHARRERFDVVVLADRGQKAAGKGNVILGIRPEDVTIADEGLAGEIYVVEPLGRDDLIDVRVGEASIRVLADPALGLKIGDTVRLNFNGHKVQFFDPETEQSLLWGEAR